MRRAEGRAPSSSHFRYRVGSSRPVDRSTRVEGTVGRMTTVVPVLMLSGPVGAGKSTIGAEIARLLREAGVPGAFVDLAVINQAWPAPVDDQWNDRLVHDNLDCMWRNFAAVGASRLVLCRVLEDRSLLRRVEAAVPGAYIIVVRLRVPLATIEERLRAREAPRPADWYVDAARYLVDRMEVAGVDDHVVDNDNREPSDVASTILHRIGWLP
jgi:hypothetical protein